MRRFTRLTNAFSKKFENHVHMVLALHRVLQLDPHFTRRFGSRRLWPLALPIGCGRWRMLPR